MDLSQTLFYAHISDGYSIRNTFNIIKGETDDATMILSPDKIQISFINNLKCAIHKVIINTSEIPAYSYNIRDSNGELMPEYPVAFNTNAIFNTTKGIGRRDGIRIYILKDDNKISIQPIKGNSKDPGRAGALFVPILTLEYSKYDVNGTYNSEPNVRVQAKEFADICSQVNTLKCNILEIVGQNYAVTFRGLLPNNKIASVNRFTANNIAIKNNGSFNSNGSIPKNMDEIDNLIDNLCIEPQPKSSALSLNIVTEEDLMTVKVPISTVKALSKIHNISPQGTLLKFYFAQSKPTKIESPIGTYGTYVICLRSK